MPCERVAMGGGVVATVCTRGRRTTVRCRWCGSSAPLACDHTIARGKTCDAPMCHTHALTIGRDVHLCPDHAAQAPEPPVEQIGLFTTVRRRR